MCDEKLPINRTKVNLLHCITRNTRTIYRICIEDSNGKQLTPWVELSRDEAKYATQLSLVPLTKKNDLGGMEDDYLIPIIHEDILRARLYPAD